ncbi:MAG: LysM peptidoglycan-binding domain-containing protein [Flavobacteriales bacterium]|nr:LysM peptidoglycan-binding domain-containing protein [Flavobacteriales bacterium]MCB9167857.1 LysM peptidoglycan-binding domain-containing protein [Flavobacteriales bacterium]
MMRSRLLLTFTFLLLFCSAWTQDVRTIEGRKYTVHHVLAGQTLFALSKHYAVPIEAIVRANPSAAQGLSIGQELLIPQDAVVKKEARSAPALYEGELAHEVQKKETLFGIARRYGLEVADLVERNPELAQGLKVGELIIIPVAKVVTANPAYVEPAGRDDQDLHVVQPGETLYSLARSAGVDPEAIRAANGGLPEGLKAGRTIRLPKATPVVEEKEVAPALPPGTRYKVGLLLPFALERNDSLHQNDLNARGLYELTGIAAQFYAGARMAMDSLQQEGLNADVYLYDTGEDERTWGAKLRQGELRQMDLFIGPFHRAAVEQLATLVKDVPIVVPAPQSNRVILGHPGVVKAIASRSDQVQQLARYAATRYAGQNIVLLRPNIPGDREMQDLTARILRQSLAVRPDRLRDSVRVARPDRAGLNDLVAQLDPVRENILMAPSEDVEFVAGLITRLVPMTDKFRIKLFGLASWNEMGTLDIVDLSKLDVHVPAGYFIDRNDPRVLRFVHAFQSRFNTEPGQYAFLGFDIGMYFLKGLLAFGRELPAHFNAVRTEPLSIHLQLVQAGLENGYRNESAVVLEHRDLGLRPAP